MGKAVARVFGNFAAAQQLQIKYDDVDKRINVDATVVRAMGDWSARMKRSGYSYARDTEPHRGHLGRAGLYPALRAASLQPVEALRSGT